LLCFCVFASKRLQRKRSNITDIVFMILASEAESGHFFLSGAANVYVIRFVIDRKGSVMRMPDSFYFYRHVLEAVSIRLFHAMNKLSDRILRCLFHRPESQTMMQSFKLLLFPSEAFWYLVSKASSQCISIIVSWKQQTTK
jgi:hypothetical protein